jgi:TonB family protein
MMQRGLTKKLFRNSVALSILLHLLVLLSMTRIIFFTPGTEKTYEDRSPQLYVPAYTYSGSVKPVSHRSEQTTEAKNIQKEIPTSSRGINRPEPSVLDMSRSVLQHNQIQEALSRPENVEPLLLVGDEHQVASPLVIAVGKSLSAHFHYPRNEGNFGIKGKVLVQFILHPEGYYTDVQIVKSSSNQAFDAAALYAVNTAPTVIGIDKLLKGPTPFVVGFIFD